MTDLPSNHGNESKATVPLFKGTDIVWCAGIVLVMANSGIWTWLSPRPEVGQVSVLWLPNAVLFAAIIRNWGRWFFCGVACAVFMIVGLVPSFINDDVGSSTLLLVVDLVEVWLFAGLLASWLGYNFRLNSALGVAVFSIAAVIACIVGGVLAAAVSQFSTGQIVVAAKAPLQVGVSWFTADLATYFFAAVPLIILTGPMGRRVFAEFKAFPIVIISLSLLVMALTLAGFALPTWLADKTGLALGSGGLVLIAFPLATFLAFRYGTAGAAITGSAIGIPSIYATMAGIGPFGTGAAADNVFDMQATLIVCTVTLLLIGGMADAMRARTMALERALDEAIKMRQSRQ